MDGRKSPSEGSVPPPHHDSHPSHYAEVSAAEAAISSTENLLRNIQGLLKVAADNAKQQERRVNLEKGRFPKIRDTFHVHRINSVLSPQWPR